MLGIAVWVDVAVDFPQDLWLWCMLAARGRVLRRSALLNSYANMQKISFPRPDDMHLHLRDDDNLKSLMAAWPGTFARGIIMPNLRPPITTLAAAIAYR